MSWTYNASLATDRDKVRLALGDTDAASPIFSDEEIDAMLAIYDGVLDTAAAMADSASAKYARMVSISVDGLSTQYSDLSRNFSALAARLRARAAQDGAGLGVPSVSGVSLSDMKSVDENADRVPSQFKMGQFDNPPREGGSGNSQDQGGV